MNIEVIITDLRKILEFYGVLPEEPDQSKEYLKSLTMILSKLYTAAGGIVEFGNKFAGCGEKETEYSKLMKKKHEQYQDEFQKILGILAYFVENYGKNNDLVFDLDNYPDAIDSIVRNRNEIYGPKNKIEIDIFYQIDSLYISTINQ